MYIITFTFTFLQPVINFAYYRASTVLYFVFSVKSGSCNHLTMICYSAYTICLQKYMHILYCIIFFMKSSLTPLLLSTGGGPKPSCFIHKTTRIVGGMQVQRAEDGSWVVSIQKGYTHPVWSVWSIMHNPSQPKSFKANMNIKRILCFKQILHLHKKIVTSELTGFIQVKILYNINEIII